MKPKIVINSDKTVFSKRAFKFGHPDSRWGHTSIGNSRNYKFTRWEVSYRDNEIQTSWKHSRKYNLENWRDKNDSNNECPSKSKSISRSRDIQRHDRVRFSNTGVLLLLFIWHYSYSATIGAYNFIIQKPTSHW